MENSRGGKTLARAALSVGLLGVATTSAVDSRHYSATKATRGGVRTPMVRATKTAVMQNLARSAFEVRCDFASLSHRVCNLISLRRLARNIISYYDANNSDLRRVAGRIRGRDR